VKIIVVGIVAAVILAGCKTGGELTLTQSSAPKQAEETSQPSIVVVSERGGRSVGLAEGSWTVVQSLTVEVEEPGYLQLTASGGEPVVDILPSDSYRFTSLHTLIGVGLQGRGPEAPGTFLVACCGDDPFRYRVASYSLSETVHLTEPGTYMYNVYAASPSEGDAETSVLPGTFTAVFFPD